MLLRSPMRFRCILLTLSLFGGYTTDGHCASIKLTMSIPVLERPDTSPIIQNGNELSTTSPYGYQWHNDYIYPSSEELSTILSKTPMMRVNKKDGTIVYIPLSEILDIRFDGLTGIDNFNKFKDVMLNFNQLKLYPNPTESSVTIEYELPESGNVDLKIFNSTGSLVYQNVFKNLINGRNQFLWNGLDMNNRLLRPGTYHCNVSFKGTNLFSKIIIIK